MFYALCLCLWRSLCRRLDFIPLFGLLFFPYAYAIVWTRLNWIRVDLFWEKNVSLLYSIPLVLCRFTKHRFWYLKTEINTLLGNSGKEEMFFSTGCIKKNGFLQSNVNFKTNMAVMCLCLYSFESLSFQLCNDGLFIKFRIIIGEQC